LTNALRRDRLSLLTDGERRNTARQEELKSTARTWRKGKKCKKDTISWEQTEAFIDNKGLSVFWASKQSEDEA